MVWVQAETVSSLGLRGLHDRDGERLGVEAGDLDVEVLQAVDEGGLVGFVPVVGHVVDHLVLGQVGDGGGAEGVAEAVDAGSAGFLGDLVVVFCCRVVDEGGDFVDFVEDACGGRGAVVEHEEDGAGDGVEEVGWEAESVIEGQ